MANTYIIRNPPPETWRRFKMLAAQQGKPMRTILLALIADYVGKAAKAGKRAA